MFLNDMVEPACLAGKISAERVIMRSPKLWAVLLASLFIASGPLAFAQSAKPSDDSAQPKPATAAATEEEVQQLRREVAELKAQIQRLIQTSAQPQSGAAHLVQASAVADSVQPDSSSTPASATTEDIDALQKEIDVLQKKASDTPPVTAGWNGEHFYLKSSDGNFTLQPVGYLNAQYAFYRGDGAPPDTFSIRRARFGVQGNYGKQLDYAFLFETASALTIRDAYIDFKPWNWFKIM